MVILTIWNSAGWGSSLTSSPSSTAVAPSLGLLPTARGGLWTPRCRAVWSRAQWRPWWGAQAWRWPGGVLSFKLSRLEHSIHSLKQFSGFVERRGATVSPEQLRMVRGRATEGLLQGLSCHRMQGMQDTRMVAEEVKRLGRENDLSVDHRVRLAIIKGMRSGICWTHTNQDFLGWQLIYDFKWGAAKDLMEKTLPETSRGMLTNQVD